MRHLITLLTLSTLALALSACGKDKKKGSGYVAPNSALTCTQLGYRFDSYANVWLDANGNRVTCNTNSTFVLDNNLYPSRPAYNNGCPANLGSWVAQEVNGQMVCLHINEYEKWVQVEMQNQYNNQYGNQYSQYGSQYPQPYANFNAGWGLPQNPTMGYGSPWGTPCRAGLDPNCRSWGGTLGVRGGVSASWGLDPFGNVVY